MKRKIKVGIIHSLSGTMSFSESPLVDAALMAFDEINHLGGVSGLQVTPIVEDCTSDAGTYAVKTTRLIKKNKIKHFFGCWTSASRKAVKPVVESHDALLWYPVQYEGLEESPNIVYTGNCLNQQIEPAVKWAAENMGKKCYLVGSDYLFPRTANRLIRTLCRQYGVEVLGERYLPLGAENFERIVEEIIKKKPDVVFNTINGDSNLAFYYYLGRTGSKSEQIPVMAFSIGEVELADIGLSVIGHYACSGYFQCLKNSKNLEFIHRFKQRYGKNRVVSDPVVSAYVQPFLWKHLVEKCNSFDVAVLKKQIAGISYKGPSGTIEIHPNHHAVRPALIGKVNSDLQFDIVWQPPQWIEPLPWLGLEQMELNAKGMVKEAMAAFPIALDCSGKLQQEIEKRKQVECDLKKEKSELKETRSKYKALLKSIPVGVVIVDLETGMIEDCNPWFEKLIGKNKSALKKRCIWQLGPPDQWESGQSAFFQHKQIGNGQSGQVCICKSDGQEAVFDHRSTPIKVNGRAMLQSTFTNGSEDAGKT
ncbi:MAG: transporter substrate-binding protein [Desulfobacteraceae bacterium]|jgi:urea transport system substrate-binding protein